TTAPAARSARSSPPSCRAGTSPSRRSTIGSRPPSSAAASRWGSCGWPPLTSWAPVVDSGAVPIVDAHLDLAYNVVDVGRDLTRSAAELRASERQDAEQVTATLPDLRRGGVAVVFGTIFTEPAGKDLGAAVPMSGVGGADEHGG